MLIIPFTPCAAQDVHLTDEVNRKGGNRYEAMLPVNRSAAFSLLAFHQNAPGPFQRGDNLKVLFYKPDSGLAKISAGKITGLSNYQMVVINNSWKSGWQQFSPWRVDDVLIPNSIRANDLGLLIQDKQARLYPAAILKEREQLEGRGTYQVHFKTQTAIDQLQYEILNKSRKPVLEGKKEDIEPAAPFVIRVRMPAEQPAGFYTLVLHVKYNTGSKSDKQYTFYHAAR